MQPVCDPGFLACGVAVAVGSRPRIRVRSERVGRVRAPSFHDLDEASSVAVAASCPMSSLEPHDWVAWQVGVDVLCVGSRTFAVGWTIPVLACELPIDALVNVPRVVACRGDLEHSGVLADGRCFPCLERASSPSVAARHSLLKCPSCHSCSK